jgi:MgtE intracellular N domain
MKTAMLAVVSFTVPFLGTTYWLVSHAPTPPPTRHLAADSTARADSLLADSLWRDSVVVADRSAAQPTEGVEHGAALPAPQVDVGQQAIVAEPEREATPTSTPTDQARQAASRSLSRVFAQMKPADAAQVIMHLTDDEVERVLRNLGARQAAAILTNLPERRAAALARRLMIPPSGTKQ